MSIEDGDNIRFNNAVMAAEIIEIDLEAARMRRYAASLELQRQKLLLAEAEKGKP